MSFDPTQVQVLGDHDACGVGFVADRLGRPSHEWLALGLEALRRLTHRGGGGDALGTADGCGVLTAIPWPLLDSELPASRAGDARPRALGACLVPRGAAGEALALVTRSLADEGWTDLWPRPVPIDESRLGAVERETRPELWQFVAWSPLAHDRLEWSLYRARLLAEQRFARAGLQAAVTSLSTRTVVYKALATPGDLPAVLPDLSDPRFATPFVVFHQRFSTNTFPDWAMAQPFHLLGHNGEINTIVGNRLKAARRQCDAAALPELADLETPAVSVSGSDSRSLDDQIALLVHGGLALPHAAARVLRRAWEHDRSIPPDERAFELCQSAFGDSWEGPAAVALSDGRTVGLVVDRSGFRPARVLETTGGLVVAASETGVVDVPEGQVAARRRVGPGEMLFVDLREQRVLDHRSLRRALAAAQPYRAWVADRIMTLPRARSVKGRHEWTGPHAGPAISEPALRRCQRLFGYTAEELEVILRPMIEQGQEAVGSMGDDAPLAALTTRARLVPDYFRQRFAQVTNPPLDPLREHAVMSLLTLMGRQGRVLDEPAPGARLVAAESPLLTNRQLAMLARTAHGRAVTLSLDCDGEAGAEGLRAGLARLANEACDQVRNGASIVILSDRHGGVPEAPMPPLLATSAVHQALGRAGLGTRASLVVDTGEARDSHQVAALLAFGAAAVCPWLGYATAAALAPRVGLAPRLALERYQSALEAGLRKILSKMGVCTADAYRGSHLFEIAGLEPGVAAEYFPSTPLVAGHVTLDQIARDAHTRQQAAAAGADALPHPGFHGFRRDGDHHMFNPMVVKALHRASGANSAEAYGHFTALLHDRPPTAVRDLLTFVPQAPVPIDEVEPVESICTRFFASAMSIGALGPEAHRTLAMALNRLGGRSNSGEGGEEPDRATRAEDGTWANSVTKQVASARFGVTPAYLASARELQIKMAQGSKPGEGGQLPAQKVVDHIARLRHAAPGTPLISPPPHHDIYSIEDLAQLIYDLRAFHPTARINVKLVSTLGVGVIAAGVVKAGAQAIQISGHAGGTGASPRGSIKHAGLPWEVGLLEAHRVLAARGMRRRVVLQTDGGLVSGRDVAMAAALGADEYGFGTSALVALGCVMARQCHLNTCPVGIATQRRDLRAKFAGSIDQVVSYLRLVAGDVRAILASLGLRSLDELVGRVDLLAPRPGADTAGIDVRHLLAGAARAGGAPAARGSAREAMASPPAGELTLNERLLRRCSRALGRTPVALETRVRNTDRTVGARLMGAVAVRRGDHGVPDAPVRLRLSGDAGQSLGAFLLPGAEIDLRGTANDGVGKGMHGGVIAISAARAGDTLIGNAALYGATGGRLFVAGSAGERFAVRNSGAVAVVEGVGHHGCEYMTAGLVVVLGATGGNFAAGMTGGLAFVYDPGRALASRLNRQDVVLARPTHDQVAPLLALVDEHWRRTGSHIARGLLDAWPRALRAFRVVVPLASGGSSDGVALHAASTGRPGLRADRGVGAADAGSRLGV